MRRLLLPPPLFLTIYQASVVVLCAVLALLVDRVVPLPPWVFLALSVAVAAVLRRVVLNWWSVCRARKRGGY